MSIPHGHADGLVANVNESNLNEAYYINPETSDAIKLTSPEQSWRVIKEQGLGISNENIRKIEVGELE